MLLWPLMPPAILERFDLSAQTRVIEESLTSRQRQILAWVADAATNKTIAEEMNLNIKTVESDLGNIFEQLGVDNRIHAAVIYALVVADQA